MKEKNVLLNMGTQCLAIFRRLLTYLVSMILQVSGFVESIIQLRQKIPPMEAAQKWG